MRTLIYLFIAICLMSCDDEMKEGFPGPKGIDLLILNKEGNNLINSDAEHAIEFEKVKNLYLINGELVNQFHGNLDSPKLCSIVDSKHSLGYIFRLTLSEHTTENNTSTTVIDWGNGDSDTIVATMDPYTKLPFSNFWYNGVPMKELTEKTFGEGNYYFEIKKAY